MEILKISENFSIINDKCIEHSLSLCVKENGRLGEVKNKKLEETIYNFNRKYYERKKTCRAQCKQFLVFYAKMK